MKYHKKLRYILCIFISFSYFLNSRLAAQTFPVDTIMYNGSPEKYINIVFVGDGFLPEEIPAFINRVEEVTEYLFSTPPFAEYKNYFNIFALEVPSQESGTDHPGTATDVTEPVFPVKAVDTYFSGTFDYSVHRCTFLRDFGTLYEVLNNTLPLYNQAVVLLNSPHYGGCASPSAGVAVMSMHSSVPEILIHEMGHSLGLLADEYWPGYGYDAANMTMVHDSTVKWNNWLGYKGVGIYRYDASSSWYRPHQSCKMRYLGKNHPFCAVCKEQLVKRFHLLFGSPIVASHPQISRISYCEKPLEFEISMIKPIPNTLLVTWILNGDTIAYNIDSLTITAEMLNRGNNDISVEIVDTTRYLRDSLYRINNVHRQDWTISYDSLIQPVITPDGLTTICEDETITLTSSPAVKYLWSDSSVVQSITVSEAGEYTVMVIDTNGCSLISAPITIHTIAVPDTPVITISGPPTFCGGDSIVLTSSTAAAYLWNDSSVTQSIIITESGNYSVESIDSTGCSTASLPTTITVKMVDTSVSLSSPTLIAGASDATYQWVDCNKGMQAINGATGKYFTPETDGSYAVVITQDGCVDTSRCVEVNLTSNILVNDFGQNLKIWPNPTSGKLSLKLGIGVKQKVFVSVKNSLGQEVYNKYYFTPQAIRFTIPGNKGIYFINVKAGENRAVIKIVKN